MPEQQRRPVEQRRPRLVDPGYLEWLRAQPCACGCRQAPPCDAAHVRASSLNYDKPLTGAGRKPDDKWALPLKRAHHVAQHAFGDEILWWNAHGVNDVFALCQRYYRRYGGTGGKPQTKKRRAYMRRPADKRKKIPRRPFPEQQRKLRSKPQWT